MVEQRSHRVVERAHHRVEADASEAHPRFGLLARRRDEHDRRARRDHLARVLREPSAEADVDRSPHMPRREVDVVARVEDDGALGVLPHHLVERDGRRWLLLVEELAGLAIEVRVEREVQRRRGLALQHGIDELVLGHRRECVVRLPLLADRRLRLGRDVLAARRARAMSREARGSRRGARAASPEASDAAVGRALPRTLPATTGDQAGRRRR